MKLYLLEFVNYKNFVVKENQCEDSNTFRCKNKVIQFNPYTKNKLINWNNITNNDENCYLYDHEPTLQDKQIFINNLLARHKINVKELKKQLKSFTKIINKINLTIKKNYCIL